MEQLDWTEGLTESLTEGWTAGRTGDRTTPRDRIEPAARTNRPDARSSWVDAVVTLLATILFGLGCTLVELERAQLLENGYAGPTAGERVAPADSSGAARIRLGRRDGVAPWTELTQRSSKR